MKKSSVIALTVAAAMGLGSVSAFAQPRGGEHHEFHQQQQQQRHWTGGRQGGWNHAGWEHHRGGFAPGYYAQPQYYGYDDGGDAAGAAIVGALLGGIIGSQLANR